MTTYILNAHVLNWIHYLTVKWRHICYVTHVLKQSIKINMKYGPTYILGLRIEIMYVKLLVIVITVLS